MLSGEEMARLAQVRMMGRRRPETLKSTSVMSSSPCDEVAV